MCAGGSIITRQREAASLKLSDGVHTSYKGDKMQGEGADTENLPPG